MPHDNWYDKLLRAQKQPESSRQVYIGGQVASVKLGHFFIDEDSDGYQQARNVIHHKHAFGPEPEPFGPEFDCGDEWIVGVYFGFVGVSTGFSFASEH